MCRLALVLVLVPVLVTCFVACHEEPEHTHDAGSEVDAGPEDVDAGPGSGAACTFNADCPDAERCACTEESGCGCETGVRGGGVSGVDVCVDGNDCETSLCVEGNGDFYCSGPCIDESDCGAQLPVCADIALLGRVCIRDPAG